MEHPHTGSHFGPATNWNCQCPRGMSLELRDPSLIHSPRRAPRSLPSSAFICLSCLLQSAHWLIDYDWLPGYSVTCIPVRVSANSFPYPPISSTRSSSGALFWALDMSHAFALSQSRPASCCLIVSPFSSFGAIDSACPMFDFILIARHVSGYP